MIRFNNPLRLVDIRTPRLIFRPFLPADIPQVARLCADPQFQQFVPLPPGTPEQIAASWFEAAINRWKNDGTGFCVLQEINTGALVGLAGLLVQPVENFFVLEVAYHLLPEHRGKGYAIEAASALRDYAFRNTGEQRLYSLIHVNNVPSQKVAYKNGMISSGTSSFKGLPVFLYSIDRVKWQGWHMAPGTMQREERSTGLQTFLVFMLYWIGGALAAKFYLNTFTDIHATMTLFAATFLSIVFSAFAIAFAMMISMGARAVSRLITKKGREKLNRIITDDAEAEKAYMIHLKVWVWLACVVSALVFAVMGFFADGEGSLKTFAVIGVIYSLLLGVAFVSRWLDLHHLEDAVDFFDTTNGGNSF